MLEFNPHDHVEPTQIRIRTGLVFFAIAGGLAPFGVSGLVLGPVALVTAIGLLNGLSRRSTRRAT